VMLLHPHSLQSLTRELKLEILGGRPTLSVLYLDSILLMCLKVVWICSRKVTEVGFAQDLVVLTTLPLSGVEPVIQPFPTDLYIL
jgi:hypothetical protein